LRKDSRPRTSDIQQNQAGADDPALGQPLDDCRCSTPRSAILIPGPAIQSYFSMGIMVRSDREMRVVA
jgi:hypothetical protein